MKNYRFMRAVLFLATVVLVILIAVGFITTMWYLWSYVFPKLWPSGPAEIITPDYVVFFMSWILLITISQVFRGR